MSETTRGRRIPTPPTSWEAGNPPYQPGDYWPWEGGRWHAVTPNGLPVNLHGHTVTEHADGTISVTPSILASSDNYSWHGYLTLGVWREWLLPWS